MPWAGALVRLEALGGTAFLLLIVASTQAFADQWEEAKRDNAGNVEMRIRSMNLREKTLNKKDVPYDSQSPPHPIIGYLEVGSKPHVRRIALVEPWPYWEVQLLSGARGYLFAPDVEVSRK